MQDLVIYATESHMHGYQPMIPAHDPDVNGQVIKGFFFFSFTSFFRCAISLSTGLTLLACTDE